MNPVGVLGGRAVRSGIGWLVVAATSGSGDWEGSVQVHQSQPAGFADEKRNRGGLSQLFGEASWLVKVTPVIRL